MTVPPPAASALAKLCRVVDAFRSGLRGDPVVIGPGSAHKSLSVFQAYASWLSFADRVAAQDALSPTGQAKSVATGRTSCPCRKRERRFRHGCLSYSLHGMVNRAPRGSSCGTQRLSPQALLPQTDLPTEFGAA